jgi:predicted DNA-binding transcriptional regulator YafY
LPLLARRLTGQEGVPPRVEVPPETAPADLFLGRGGAAHLWMTAEVYQALGDFIELPAHLPSELPEHLAALADAGHLAAAKAAAERTLNALRDALDGRAVLPIWTETTLPVEESLALIEKALAEGEALAMEYYTAGRDALTHRVVEPHRVERRGDVAYLIGFCHRAQAERTFRVSRIRALQLTPLPSSPDAAVDWDL